MGEHLKVVSFPTPIISTILESTRTNETGVRRLTYNDKTTKRRATNAVQSIPNKVTSYHCHEG